MNYGQFLVSLVGGGLAGGLVSTIANHWHYIRSLRTRFYPRVNDILAAYMIRLERPDKQILIQRPGLTPMGVDRDFVNHRSNFIGGLVEFNELKEARELRQKLVSVAVVVAFVLALLAHVTGVDFLEEDFAGH